MDDEYSRTIISPVQTIVTPREIESSEEPPMEEWSSLEIEIYEENKKKLLYKKGLYDPGTGDMCDQYIAMSDSSVFRHPYFSYPAIKDPGIQKALLEPGDVVVYPDDGQALYMAKCEEMRQVPVRSFHKALLTTKIDLRYYCVNPYGIRAMAAALESNKTVTQFSLMDNFLNNDSCFHLGEMLLTNHTLTELNLSGCKIGPEGASRLLSFLSKNRGLVDLNLSRNHLGDDGMEPLAAAILYGLNVKKINLSNNDITGKGLMFLTEAFETHNRFTHINLSWNKLFTPGSYAFIMKLSESDHLQHLDLSWNSLTGPRIGAALKSLFLCPTIKSLNFSNNKLDGEAIRTVVAILNKAKALVSLNLSYNPLKASDALFVLNKMKLPSSKLHNLYLENVDVSVEFLETIAQIKQMKSKKKAIITYGGVLSDFVAKGPDPRDLIMNRIEYLTQKPKKNKIDFALLILQLEKDNISIMNAKDFIAFLQYNGAKFDEGLNDELINIFPGSRTSKIKMINISTMAEYIRRKWPDRVLPPTPPPELEPEPEPILKTEEKGKAKRKK